MMFNEILEVFLSRCHLAYSLAAQAGCNYRFVPEKTVTLEVMHFSSVFAQSHPRATKDGSADVEERCAGYHQGNTKVSPQPHQTGEELA